jgi:2-dehydro-3-deoxyphosphogluconate aldolase/(4S)-4-hydroxy-2-oxoglutarate aldolase
MSSKQQVIDSIIKQGMLPLFFYTDEEVSLQIIRTLYKAGVRVLEYTNRGTTALDNFIALKKAQLQEMPGMYLGAGTVKSVEDAEAFISAGADFIVSPIVNPEVGKIAARHQMLWIPGCMSPTEIYLAQQNGAAIIKIFPANVVGPGFISAVKEVFGGQLLMPTGGVDLSRENISSWFGAGVCAVGMGSKLISKNVLENRLYDRLYTDTLAVLEIIKSVNSPLAE